MAYQTVPWTDGAYAYQAFFSPTKDGPNSFTQWDTYNSSPTGATGECINGIPSYGNGGSSQVSGYYQSYGDDGGACRGVGTNNFVFTHMYNYGDLANTQSSGVRAKGLENILCIGDSASPFNSPNT